MRINTDKENECNLLMIPEQTILFLANFDRRSTILRRHTSVSNTQVPLDLTATYLRNQHAITGLDAARDTLAVLVEAPGSDSQHLGLVELLDRRLGQEDARGRLGLGLDALHQHAVEEGRQGANGFECGSLARGSRLVMVDGMVVLVMMMGVDGIGMIDAVDRSRAM